MGMEVVGIMMEMVMEMVMEMGIEIEMEMEIIGIGMGDGDGDNIEGGIKETKGIIMMTGLAVLHARRGGQRRRSHM